MDIGIQAQCILYMHILVPDEYVYGYSAFKSSIRTNQLIFCYTHPPKNQMLTEVKKSA